MRIIIICNKALLHYNTPLGAFLTSFYGHGHGRVRSDPSPDKWQESDERY